MISLKQILKKTIKYFLEFFVYTNLHIGILATSLAWSNSVLLASPNQSLLLFIFFSTILIYNMDRLISFQSDFINSPSRSSFITRHVIFIKIIICLSVVIILLLTIYFNSFFRIIVFFLFMLTVSYLFLFNGEISNRRNLSGFPGRNSLKIQSARKESYFGSISWSDKKISFMKPVLLAFVWASATIILPIIHSGKQISLAATGLFLIRYIEYLVNGIFFDFKDLSGDSKNYKKNIFLDFKPDLVFQWTALLLIIETGFILGFVFFRILPFVIISDLLIVFFYLFLLLNIWNIKLFGRKTMTLKVSSLAFSLLADGILAVPAIFFFFYQ